MSLGEVYARGRARITGVAEAAGDRAAATRVPACPQWSVHDVVAHLAGACDDILTGNLEGVATDAWTAAQVGKRRGASIADVLAEWAELAPRVEAIADTFPEPYGPQLITDLVTHEHDIRGALGVHGARESDAVRVGADFVVRWGFTLGIAARGLPAVAVRAKGKEWTAGDGDPPVTLEASEFEVLRALTGRRTVDQIRALRWSDDPAPYLPVFTYGPFTLPAQPLAD